LRLEVKRVCLWQKCGAEAIEILSLTNDWTELEERCSRCNSECSILAVRIKPDIPEQGKLPVAAKVATPGYEWTLEEVERDICEVEKKRMDLKVVLTSLYNIGGQIRSGTRREVIV